MKKLNILYWTSTGLFALFMGMTGIQNMLVTQSSIDLITTDSDTPASLRSRVDGLRALLPPAAKS